MSDTGERKIDLGSAPGWLALAEAHRESMVLTHAAFRRTQAGDHPTPEPGSPQADHESPEDFIARRAAEEAWRRDETESAD